MKKSNVFSNKFCSVKDVLNGLSPLTVVALTAFAVLMTIGVFAPYTTPDYKLATGLAETLSRNLHKYLFLSNDAEVFAYIVPLVTAISQFAFLHEKSKCYTLLSLSVKRKTIFNNRYILPLICMIAITLIIKGIALGMNIYYLQFSAELLKNWLIHVTICLQLILVIYSVSVFCCHMCGRTIEAIVASVCILVLPVVLSYLSQEALVFSLYGYIGSGEIFLTSIFNFVNPVCIEEYAASSMRGNEELPYDFTSRILSCIIWIITSIGISFFTKKYFAERYSPEVSGFKGAKKIIVYIISLTMAMFGASLGLELVRGYFYPLVNTQVKIISVLIALSVAVISAVLCNFVVHFTFKRVKVALVAGATAGLFIFVIMIIGTTGIFGTFNKLPDKKDIKQIEISVPFPNFIPTTDYTQDMSDYYPYISESLYISSEEEIELVLDIHESILENKSTDSVSEIYIQYTLSNGSYYTRKYTYLSDVVLERSLELWDTEAAKNVIKGHLVPEEYCKSDVENATHTHTSYTDRTKIEFRSKYNVVTDVSPLLSAEQSLELRKAVLKDIMNMSYEDWFRPTDVSLGEIHFTTTTDALASCDGSIYKNSFLYTTPVYESMTNTLSVIEKYDLTGTLTQSLEVKCLYIADFRELVKWGNKAFDNGSSIDLKSPYFDTNYYILMHLRNHDDAPIKRITDINEINKYISNGYTQYLIGNKDATYILAEFEGSTPDEYKGNILMIPK